MQFISGKKAKGLIASKNALLIDTRDAFVFSKGSLPGAKNLSLRNLTNELMVQSKKKKVPIILFSNENDEDMPVAVKYAENYGFDVFVLKNMAEWEKE